MTTPHFSERIARPNPDLRAADADRERIATRLRESHADGRLDMAEFQQRLERCYEAKTLGELDELVKDLPRQDDEAGRRRPFVFSPWRLPMAPLAPILLALLVVSAATGHHVVWLWLPLIFLFWRLSWWRTRRWWAGAPRRWDQRI